MQWSNRYPGTLTRPALLPAQAETGVREMSQGRCQTPCDILEKRGGESAYGGVGTETTVITASTVCDVEPIAARDSSPPKGFENETLYHVYLPRTQHVPRSARIRVPGWLAPWESEQDVGLEALRVPSGEWGNGRYYECVQAGETGGQEPLWDTRTGSRTVDGTAVWKDRGEAFTLEVLLHDGERSREGLICVLAQLLK